MAQEMVQIGRYAIDKDSVDVVIRMLSLILAEETVLDERSCVYVAQRLLVGMTNGNEQAELAWILDNKREVEDVPPSTWPVPYPPRRDAVSGTGDPSS